MSTASIEKMTAGSAPLRATGTLIAAQPFSLQQALKVLGKFPPCRGDLDCDTSALAAALSIEGRQYAIRVTQSGNEVRYGVYGHQSPSGADEAEIRETITCWLSLNDDLSAFYAMARADTPQFASLVAAQHGLHHVRYLTVAEAVVWLVLTQGTRRPIARQQKSRVVAGLGGSVTVGGRTFTTFPELPVLAGVPASRFAELTGNPRKGEYLASVVGAVASLGPQWLRTAPYDEAEAALRAVRGIGPFTADGILMRGLGRMERLASLDTKQFREPALRVYGDGYTPERIRDRYRGCVGYWAYYLRNSGA